MVARAGVLLSAGVSLIYTDGCHEAQKPKTSFSVSVDPSYLSVAFAINAVWEGRLMHRSFPPACLRYSAAEAWF